MPRIPLRPDVHGHGGSHGLHFHIRLHQWQPFQTLQSHRNERQRMQRFIVDEANQKKKGAKLPFTRLRKSKVLSMLQKNDYLFYSTANTNETTKA